MKHQRDIHALSALNGIYSTAKSFEVWLHHDIDVYNYIYMYHGKAEHQRDRQDCILDTVPLIFDTCSGLSCLHACLTTLYNKHWVITYM